jgi:RNA polymerase-binding protein DksA
MAEAKKAAKKKTATKKATVKKAAKKAAPKKARAKKVAAKKTPAKKTATKAAKKVANEVIDSAPKLKPVVKKGPKLSPQALEDNFKPLTKKEIEHYHGRLLQQRRQLIGDVDHMSLDALKNNRQESSGDLSSMPIHMADIGTDNYEQEFTLGLIASDRKLLKDIDYALFRIDDGTYGTCDATGEPIGRARLDAKPYARYCIDFARKLEQGLVREPQDELSVEELE